MAPSKVRPAVASMNQPETRIGDRCAGLGITLRMRLIDRRAQRSCPPTAPRRIIGHQNAPSVLSSFLNWLDGRSRSVLPQNSVG